MLNKVNPKERVEGFLIMLGIFVLFYLNAADTWLVIIIGAFVLYLHDKTIKTRIQIDGLKDEILSLKAANKD
jgi:hypothetical protein